MGFTEEYMKLRKKRTDEAIANLDGTKKKTTTKASRSFEDEYLELRNERIAEANNRRTAAGLSPYDDNGDIAPSITTDTEDTDDEKHWYDGWFQGGALDDGLTVKNIAKTILGSARDFDENFGAGVLGIGEKVVDAGAAVVGAVGGLFSDEFRDKTQEFIEKDLYDEKKIASQFNEKNAIIADKLLGVEMESDNSVLGEKSDALAQSAGQLTVQLALTAAGLPTVAMGVTGATAFGGEAENAFREGATYGEAMGSAAITAGAEILTEKLSGAINFGGAALDDTVTRAISTGISDEIGQALVKFGVDAAGEGFEEFVSEVASNLGSALYKEESLGELLFSKEARQGYIEAFVGGAVMGGAVGGGNMAINAAGGKNAVTGLDDNAQKVMQHEYESRVKEAEDGGEKLTQKDKNKIYDEVMDDMRKGYISTDTIESVLGGESYKAYKDTADEQDALQREYDSLADIKKSDLTTRQEARLQELTARLDENKRNKTVDTLKAKLSDEVMGLTSGGVLAESYNQRAQRGAAFEADVSQYDAKQQAVVQKAIDSGILNNTRRTHEFVDMVAKISADKGVLFDFANNAKLKESGFAVEGKTVNGFVTKDGVTVNIDSAKSLNSVVGHEIAHVLEGTEIYTELQNAIAEYAKTRGEYDSRRAALSELYKGIEGADVDAELTADLVGDYLFTDFEFINNLSTSNRNVFQKIYDEIKYLVKVATAGSKEARELQRVKRAFDKAYREGGKASGDTKYSVSDNNIKDLSTGYGYGETYFTMSYTQDGKTVGTLEYGEYEGQPNVKMVEVDPEYRRKGIATKLLQELQNKYPDAEIDFGMTTPDGTKLLDSITYDVTDEAVVADRQKLKDLQTELNDLQERLDVLYDTENLTEAQESELQELGDRWTEVYDTIRVLEKSLRGKKATKTFVKTDTKYSLADSDGKTLTNEQQKYFAKSKMRDDAGNLKVMYHGSQDAGFHVFDPSMSDDGTSLFFVDRNDVAASYSGTTETYTPSVMKTAEDVKRFIATIVTNGKGYDVVEKDGKFTLYYKGDEVADSDTAQGIYEEFCDFEGVGYGDANYKVYLNLENPLEVDAEGRNWDNISREFSQEVYDRYKSLTDSEKTALSEIAGWEEYGIFKDEILSMARAKANGKYHDADLASAYEKLGGANANLYDAFSIAQDNFSEESLREYAVKQMNTRDYAKKAKAEGYDGVIFKNIHDNGGYSNGSEGASTVAIAFSSEQVKSVANGKPTSDPDIRYSLTEYTAEEKKAHNDAVLEHFGKTYKWAETGYLLLDGTKLDLSGKHDGAPGGYRTVDHRDITDALGYDYGGGEYSDSLIQFMSEGNIRIVPEINGINLSVKPTKAQEQALSDYISRYRGEVVLDIDDLGGNTVVSVEYPKGTYYAKVLSDIREWFDNGKKPEVSGLSPFRSLTKNGERGKQYGNYNVYGEDVRYDPVPLARKATAPIRQNAQNAPDVPDVAPVLPDEPSAETMDTAAESERFNTLDDADMPPEVDAPFYGEEEAATVDDPFAERDIKEVGNRKINAYMYENPEVKPFFQAEANSMLGELQRSTKGERFYTETPNGQVGVYGAESYGVWSGTSRQTTDDIAYLLDTQGYTYAEIEKGLRAIIEDNGAENNACSKRIEFLLNDRLLKGHTDLDGYEIPPDQNYINLLNEKQITEYNEEAFSRFMENADRYAPPVTEDIAPAKATKQTSEPIKPQPQPQPKQVSGEPRMSEASEKSDNEGNPTQRKALHKRIMDNLKGAFNKHDLDLDVALNRAKNLSTFATVDNTPQRVMEKALGYKEGQILADETVNKVAKNETEGIKWLNSVTSRDGKGGLLKQLSKQYHIKPGSKESAAAQMYAEGFYVNDDGETVKYGAAELAKDFPNAQTQRNIKGLAADPRIRRFYDDTLAMINKSRTRNAYPEIKPLENYFLHFRAMEDTFSRLGIPFNPNDIRAKDLPTDLNGVTADLKPGQPYFASAMHRRGNRTTYDLLGGMERYATGAKNQIYHIDDIQTLRALRNYIADTYGQASGLDSLDDLPEEEVQDRIKQVYGAHLSTFAKFLNEEANVLAGKTALIDRGLEGIIGRRGITFLNALNQQVGSNMVGGNVSSSLTNLLATVQAFAKTNKTAFVKGFAQTAANRVGRMFGKADSFADNPTAIRRKGADRFYRTPWQKTQDAGYALMGAVDNVATEVIVRAKYNEFVKKGMSKQQAITEADKWASRLMGDRSLGQMPQLYNSKMLGLITKFQLEVRNQLDSQFYDTIKEAKASNEDIKNGLARNAKTAARVAATFTELAVAQHIFGAAFESIAGYNPAFDIIDVLIKTIGLDDEEESEDTALDNVEQGFLALLEDLPYTSTLTGGRVPISSALPIKELVTGKDEYGNEKSRLETLGEIAPYYVLPTGYGQIKKTAQGLSMFSDDLPVSGSYTDSGNLRFPVDDTLGNRIQAGIFGQWASGNAAHYFDNDIAPLKEKQIQEYIDVDMPIKDYWRYRDELSNFKTLAEKADYINSLDLTLEQKNTLINNIAGREEPINMANYDKYGSFEEFDFAEKNPEKYNFFKQNGISYETYKAADEDGKRAYTWAYENPGKYTMSKAISDDFLEYYGYKDAMNDFDAKDENGETVSGLKKERVIDYLNGLDLDYGQKIILFRSMYDSKDDRATYNADILDYLNSRQDISYEDTVTILEELGFKVYGDGRVTWD